MTKADPVKKIALNLSTVVAIRVALEEYAAEMDGLQGDYPRDLRNLKEQLLWAWAHGDEDA